MHLLSHIAPANNLTFTGLTRPNRGRHLTWTEDNRLIKVTEDVDPIYHSFYRYDAGGERTYKLVYENRVSRPPYICRNATMYPSPFLVITPTGYTKHYYAGMERIAARVGKGNKIQHTKPLPSGLTGSPLGVGKTNKSLKKE